jgi:hypothetical protein
MFRLGNQKSKIFCVGANKTGTTSVEHALIEHGIKLGSQSKAEFLLDSYIKRDFNPIIKYCKSAKAFQDVPFSLPFTYQVMDHEFPGSKFILTVRDTEEEWYRSITSFHGKLFANGEVPTFADLENANYRYKGFMSSIFESVFLTDTADPYNEKALKRFYRKHNSDVQEYFKFKDNLLVINLREDNAYQRFCEFLNLDAQGRTDFPWSNKTSSL